MQNTPDEDEDPWFSTLAGRADAKGNAGSNLQAQALRRALQARAQELEAKVPYADDAQYQKLLLRLQREKLLASKIGWRTSPIWVKTAGALGISADAMPWKSPMVWGLTATFVIGVAMVISLQNAGPTRTEVDVLRGGAGTTLIVEQPELRLVELLQGVRAAGEEPVVERLTAGTIILTMTAGPNVLDYLDTQRIVPAVVDGKVILVLKRPNTVQKKE